MGGHMQSRLMDLHEELKDKYIICSCEGKAEQAIIDLLLDADALIFKRVDLVGKKCTMIRSASRIEEEYLHTAYNRPVVILRILDREKEKFNLRPLYKKQYAVFSICTKPEIEILHIIHEGKWTEYKKQNKLKPSEYFQKLHGGELTKSENFIKNYYDSVDDLIAAIHEYHRISAYKDIYDLSNLLKE